MAELTTINDESGYEAALGEIEGLMKAEPGTIEGHRLEQLAAMIQAYEARHHGIDLPRLRSQSAA